MSLEQAFMQFLGIKPLNAPNETQRQLMANISTKSGIAIVQDQGTAMRVLGPLMNAAKGCFTQAKFNPWLPSDAVILNMDATDPYWYNVLFHELSHATGVKLERKGVADIMNASVSERIIEELIAESTANFIMRHLGLNSDYTDATSHQYIMHHVTIYLQEFGKKPDIEYIQSQVAKSADLILTQWL